MSISIIELVTFVWCPLSLLYVVCQLVHSVQTHNMYALLFHIMGKLRVALLESYMQQQQQAKKKEEFVSKSFDDERFRLNFRVTQSQIEEILSTVGTSALFVHEPYIT